MSNPENTTTFKIYTGNGTTVAYTMTSRITDTTDIEVYVDEVKQTSGVTITYNTSTFLVTVTFATAPANASTILIFRNTQAKFQNITASSGISSDSINAIFNNDYLSIYDRDNISDRFSLRYKTSTLSDGTGPTTAQLEIPLPTAPSTGYTNVQLIWNGTAFTWEDSTSVAGFKANLASTTNPQGASLIGYNNGSATNVQAQLDKFIQVATSTTISGAAQITYWNGTASVSVQSELKATSDSVFDLYVAATASNTGKAMDMYVWDSSDGGHSLSVGQAVIELYGTPSASNTDLGAGRVNYYNARKTATETVKNALDASLQYAIGQYIPGVVPTTTLPNGDWITIRSGESLGSATSGATHSGPGYESLYIFIRVNYLGESEATAQASWSANTTITPSTLSSNPIASVNTWRYA